MARPIPLVGTSPNPADPPAIDMHLHTDWTDGTAGVATMHQTAIAAGLKLILFSEHARRTSQDWFPDFAAQVRALPADQCQSLVGVECKVDDFGGNVDSTCAILGLCDLVMASVHRFPGEEGNTKGTTGGFSPDQAIDMEFRLSMAVMDNPAVDILGHPFAMSIKRFGAAPPWELFVALMEKSAATGVAFEINARYHAEPVRLIEACNRLGAPVSLGSNAHEPGEVGLILRRLRENRG